MGKHQHGRKKLSQMITPGTKWRDLAIHKFAYEGKLPDIKVKLRDNFIKYWTNFFIFNHEGLERVKQQIMEYLCLNGTAAIQYIPSTDTFLVFSVAAYKQRLDMQIETATLILVVVGHNRTIDNVVNDKGAVIISSDRYMTPWLLYSDEFIRNVQEGLRALSINRKNSTKTKLIRVQTLSEGKVEEIETKYDNSEPYVIIQGDIEEVQDMSMKNDEALIWDDIWQSLQFWYQLEGVRHNSLDKKAEVKEVEAKNDSMTFVALENQKIQVIEDMVERLNKLYNLSITVETIVAKQERENQERMTLNEPTGSQSGQTNESE